MGKFVFWVGVAALIWLAFKLYQVLKRKAERQRLQESVTGHEKNQDQGQTDSRRQAGAPNATDSAVPMIRCRRCGLYLPGHEAVRSGESSYCSIEHRDAADADRSGR